MQRGAKAIRLIKKDNFQAWLSSTVWVLRSNAEFSKRSHHTCTRRHAYSALVCSAAMLYALACDLYSSKRVSASCSATGARTVFAASVAETLTSGVLTTTVCLLVLSLRLNGQLQEGHSIEHDQGCKFLGRTHGSHRIFGI